MMYVLFLGCGNGEYIDWLYSDNLVDCLNYIVGNPSRLLDGWYIYNDNTRDTVLSS